MPLVAPDYFPRGIGLIDKTRLNALLNVPQTSVETGITAAAGGTQAAARQLLAAYSVVSTVATAADSVKLLPAVPGIEMIVVNDGLNSMQVFGSGTDTINGVATATGVAQAPGTTVRYISNATGTWKTTSNGSVAGGSARVTANVSATDNVTAVTSNNTFVSFAQTYTIPANTLKLGTVLRVKVMVHVTDASGTDTLTCNIRIGGTSLIATTAVDPTTTSDHHILEFDFESRVAPGATASCVGYGRWTTNTAGTLVNGTALLAATNFATNGDLVLDVQAKWSSNTASTSARLEMLNVWID